MKLKLRGTPQEGLTFLEQVLINRGVQNIDSFFDLTWDCVNDPHNLNYIDEAATMFLEHLENNSKIALLVDADMDGFSSAALIVNYLNAQYLYGEWENYVDNIIPIFHSKKAHGLSDTEVMRALRDTIQPDLLIIPDASGTEEQYAALVALGIDILVLDHHDTECRGDGESVIVVNNQHSSKYTNKDLSGVGVTWQFLRVLDERSSFIYADALLDLVALGNIADDMDLKSDETRFLCSIGLENSVIQNYFLRWCQSFLYLMKDKDYNPHNIGFYIAPMFNAVCRVGSMEEKEMLFKALCDASCHEMVKDGTRGHTGNVELVQEAVRLATNTKSRQDRRRNKITELIEKVIEEEHLIQNKVLILAFDDYEEDWKALSGVTAQQISQTYQRPCILTFKNEYDDYVGSLRAGDNVEAYLNFKDQCEASGLCTFVAGHQQAAGIGFKKENVEALNRYFNTKYADVDTEIYYDVDFVIDANDPSLPDLIQELSRCDNLWGSGIEEPRFAVTGVKMGHNTLSLMGKTKTTLCVKLPNIKFITFKSSQEEYDSLLLPYENDIDQYYTATIIAAKPEMNEFGMKVTPQAMIEDYVIEGTKYDF